MLPNAPNFVAAASGDSDKLPKCYDIGGDIRQLEFSVSLYSVDLFASSLLLGFNKFTSNKEGETVIAGGNVPPTAAAAAAGSYPQLSSSLSSSSLGRLVSFAGGKGGDDGGEQRLEEERTIRWQETIPRPTTTFATSAEEEGEEEDSEEGHRPPTEERDDASGEEDGEEASTERVPNDPKTTLPTPKEQPRQFRSVLSHRIFTLLEFGDGPQLSSTSASATDQNPFQAEQLQRTGSSATGASIRQRKIAPLDWGQSSVLKEPVQMLPARHRNRSVARSLQRMLIMAYLGAEDPYDPSEEYLLWELRLFNGRQMNIEPDLNEVRTVHSAKTGNAFRAQMAIREPLDFDSIAEGGGAGGGDGELHWDEEEDGEGGSSRTNFEVPEGNNDYWLHYMVEIGRAVGFLHDNLCVEWMLELPANCVCLHSALSQSEQQQQQQQQTPTEPLKGRTNRCSVKAIGREDVAHFGHTIEFSINYRRRHHSSTDAPPPPSSSSASTVWPRLLFRVTALESWGRFYVDGYAIVALPASPGAVPNISLPCWRPALHDSKLGALREAHLGQAVDLAGTELLRINFASSIAGLATESSGQLELSIQSVHQCRHYMARDILRSLKYSTMMRRIGISGDLQSRIVKVLEEFKRVRQQLVRARSGRSRTAGTASRGGRGFL